jgi:hypothetical protein
VSLIFLNPIDAILLHGGNVSVKYISPLFIDFSNCSNSIIGAVYGALSSFYRRFLNFELFSEYSKSGDIYLTLTLPPCKRMQVYHATNSLPLSTRGLCACNRPIEDVLPHLGMEHYFDCSMCQTLINLHITGTPDIATANAEHAELFDNDKVKECLAALREKEDQRRRDFPWVYGLPWGEEVAPDECWVNDPLMTQCEVVFESEPESQYLDDWDHLPRWDPIKKVPIEYDCFGRPWSPNPHEHLPRREMDSDGFIEWVCSSDSE